MPRGTSIWFFSGSRAARAAQRAHAVDREQQWSRRSGAGRSGKAAAVAPDPVTRAVIDIATQETKPAPAVPRFGSPQVSESYPTFNDLRAQGVLQIPDMHLDIPVYSSKPEDRFVFVNMSKYKERATLDEGPVVREITPDGVILEYRGTSFLLPRE